jgi:hypothetical protein
MCDVADNRRGRNQQQVAPPTENVLAVVPEDDKIVQISEEVHETTVQEKGRYERQSETPA